MYGKLKQYLTQELAGIQEAGLFKQERIIQSPQAAEIQLNSGQKVLNFCANNYLGLSSHPRVLDAAHKALESHGFGVSSVRFICGTQDIHKTLEKKIADFLGTEDTILYAAAFDANGGVFEPLFSEEDAIVSDALNHASIIDGVRLCKAKRYRYAHSNMEELEACLKEAQAQRFRIIVTDGVFSMDGDIADVPKFIEIKKKHNALLFLDEAHSMGVIGPNGLGARDYFNLNPHDVDLWMGTFSKSFASCGGYIAGRKALIDYLKYNTPGFVYSVGISPANAAAALASTRIMMSEPWRAQKCQVNAASFLSQAKAKGLDTGPSKDTAVVPIITGNSAHALLLADALFKEGINVQPILYPAVPEESARLRFFITSDHTEQDISFTIEKTAQHLERIRREYGNLSFPKVPMG